jgi:hypothetical protein
MQKYMSSRSSDPNRNKGHADLQSSALTPELPEHDATFFRETKDKHTISLGSAVRLPTQIYIPAENPIIAPK